MRITIDLPDSQIKALREIGLRRNMSRAALVREAVAEFVATRTNVNATAAFGAWARGRRRKNIAKRDGVPVQRTLRAEWDS